MVSNFFLLWIFFYSFNVFADCPEATLTVPQHAEVRTRVHFAIKLPAADWVITGPQGELKYYSIDFHALFTEPGLYKGQVAGANACEEVIKKSFQFYVHPRLENAAITINQGAKYTNSSEVQLRLSASGATEMLVSDSASCSGHWQNYSEDKSWRLNALNQTVSVYAKYRNPIRETACLSASIIHDDVAPKITITSQPAGWTSSQATVAFQITDASGVNATYCSLDGGATYNCVSPLRYSGLAAGPHSVEIFAQDPAGNIGRAKSAEWKVDSTPPVIRLLATPANPSSDLVQTFRFSVEDAETGISSFSCAVDGEILPSCTSPLHIEDLFEGGHTFSVAANNSVGLQSSVNYVWRIEYPLPQVFLTQVPAKETELQNAEFGFEATSSIGVDRIECSLDGSTFVPCQSPWRTPILSIGQHIFAVRAVDVKGKISEVAAHSWKILKPTKLPVVERFISAGPQTAADVLLVYDNSTSMRKEHREVAERFKDFIQILGTSDWRLAVTSTDLHGRKPYDGGRFARIAESSEFWITPNTKNANAALIETLAAIEFGSGWEQGIAVAGRALKEKFNQKFFRNNIPLVLVIISDEDERSSGKNLKTQNLPETLISAVHKKWNGGKNFIVHSVTWRPEDNSCSNGAHKARAYSRLVEMTGGLRGNICGENYAKELKRMMSSLPGADLVRELKCAPENGQLEVVIAPAAPVAVTLQGQRLTLSPAPAAGSEVTLTYHCATRLEKIIH